jgi:histidine ammonia-lyase
LIFEDEERVISGGNFHGQPMALAMDFLGIALSELANVSERRIERLVNYQLNDLPPFLTKKGGLNSGFMIAQYTAAALVSENKVLAHPASVDSIPSSANQEDHVSMGTIAARKARSILFNVSKVLGIEYLAATQGIYLREQSGKLGNGTQPAYDLIRKYIEPFEEDRIMYVEINRASELVTTGLLLKVVEETIGALK